MLPPNVAMAYPVLPRLAVPGATFHLNVECAEDFSDMMLIYVNVDFFLSATLRSEASRI
jgi:hypothetical protein